MEALTPMKPITTAILSIHLLGYAAVACAQGTRKPLAVVPLKAPVMVGQPVTLTARGSGKLVWDFGDGRKGMGPSISHTYEKPGVYRVVTSARGATAQTSLILRVHTPETVNLPQVLLDTDARNEQDDQHYIAYALKSGLDILGINSIHHGGGQEPMNYGEIQFVLQLAQASKVPPGRIPLILHGADQPLEVPASGKWSDTRPVASQASDAILAAARGATPTNPVWVLPVGPGTNVASAILQARQEGLDLKGRLRVVWLGGGPETVDVKSFNGKNDPWSVHVVAESGIETWIILENPTSGRLRIDKRTESNLYPKDQLGAYLLQIIPAESKSLFDVTTLSMVIADHLKLPWITNFEPVTVAGPAGKYRWEKSESSSVRLVRTIDHEAMKQDFFETLNGRPTPLLIRVAERP